MQLIAGSVKRRDAEREHCPRALPGSSLPASSVHGALHQHRQDREFREMRQFAHTQDDHMDSGVIQVRKQPMHKGLNNAGGACERRAVGRT